ARLLRAEGGVIVRVPSHVGPRYSVRPEGFAPLERDDVVDALSLGTERLTRGVAASMAERVVDLYRRRGFADAEAEVRPERAPREGEAILRVIVRPGKQLDVRRRVFPGAAHFEDGFLEEQMASYLDEAISRDSIFEPVDTIVADHTIGDQQRGRWEGRPPLEVDPLRIWYAPAYESAIEHVRELYEADGFLGAQVGPARLRRLGGGRAVVEVPIVEGPRTMLYGVSVRGNEALTLREILEAAELERDQPFSYLALEQAKGRVVRAYQERGFFYAEVESSVRFSGDRTRAELALRVVERYEVRVGEVILRGNRNTSEALLRRVFALEPGDLLTPSGLRETQDRLLDLGVFTSVNASPQDPELPARVKPLEVTVTERKNQYLDFRAGLSTAQGARFGAEYGYRNLFGTAVGFTLSAQFGYQFFFLDDEVEERFEALSLQDRLERRVTASIAVPYVGLPNVQTSFALTHQRENERNFGLDKNGLDLSFTWRARRWLSATLSTGLENNDVEVLGQESYEELLMQNAGDVRLRNLLRVPEGESTLVASQLGVSLDRRDNPFVPTRGFFAASSVEWARTIKADAIERAGELEQFFSHHLRIQLNATGYVPLDERSRFVFAAQLRMGRVVHLAGDSETYPNRQFFVGGVDTVRGYLQDAMVPQDLADEAEDNPDLNTRAFIQGGDRFMTVRGELRFPIAGDLRGGAFVDFGNLWIDQRLNPLELRPTAGLGLRFGTPVGPIALDYGVILARRDELNEPFGSFHFSIGLF
ncbi:MAG: hypothetical protein CMN29_13045, partial [Sandaracinus sp.]|nr:hypothetical protein [Sandaracinus sp.]